MPGQLFNLGRYFRKKNQLDDTGVKDEKTPPEPQTGGGEEVQVTTTTKTQTTTAEPYSGIGYPEKKTTTKTSVQKQTAGSSQTVASSKPSEPQETTPSATVPSSVMQKRAGMDVLTRLTQRSNKTLMTGVTKAKELKISYVDTEHVLFGLLEDSGVYQLISDLKVAPKEIQDHLLKNFKKGNFSGQPKFSPRVKRVLELSLSAARALGYEFISPEHILLSLAQEGEGMAAQSLAKFGLTVEVLNKKVTGKAKIEAEEKKKASASEQFCDDLTAKASAGKLDPVVKRSAEIERVIHILSRRTKNNPCLIGDAGVGKTAIVEGLAQRIVTGDVPETLLNKKILQLDLMSLIAGARHRGEFEERLKNLVKEIKAASGAIILFIDELHNVVGAGAGAEGTMDTSNILKPSLARGELQTIGADTIAEYRRYIEKDAALERRFQPVLVREPTIEEAIEMLRALRDRYEAYHKVSIPDEALEAAVKLSARYIGDRFLPDKAVDLIDEAASAVRLPAISLPEEIKSAKDKLKRLEEEKKEVEKLGDQVKTSSLSKEIEELKSRLEELNQTYQQKKSTTTNIVAPDIIQEIVSRWTNIPISKLTEKEQDKLLKLEELIHKRIINQEEAVEAVAEAVRRGRAGLKSTKRPIGSFIFMGPTGVGKTELAKVLAEILFGAEEMTVRLDMSEYMEKHEVAKLIGAPPGYVGYEESGQLTEQVRRRPYSVILLDEIEKAHPDVFNILIQLLDDGRLTDNKGRTISFKNTIVICTSNIGTGLIQKEMLETGGLSLLIPAMSTYVVTPKGRAIITLKDRYWYKKQKDKNDWEVYSLKDYFEGQSVENADSFDVNLRLPVMGFDVQMIAPSGEEMIIAGGRIWRKKSTTAKTWETLSLIDYYKNHLVVNALPDEPEQQLPTARINTGAISPSEIQILSFKDRFWKRENLETKDWTTGTLEDYFEGCYVVKESVKDEQKGVKIEDRKELQKREELDLVSPPVAGDGEKKQPAQEKTIEEDKELKKTQPSSGETEEIVEEIEKDQKDAKKKEKSAQEELEKVAQETDEPELHFPTQKWDIHLFTPQGREFIIAGDRYWTRDNLKNSKWQTNKLSDLFTDAKVVNADPQNTEDQLPVGQEIEKARQEKQREEDARFAELSERLLEELRKFFRPELLNRFDEVIIFRPLSAQNMLVIVDLQMEMVRKLLEEQNIGFEYSESVKNQLAVLGYDPIYGARPLRRTIQRMIENPISSLLIKEEVKAGNVIFVDFDGNDFVFSVRYFEKVKEGEKEEKITPPQSFKCLDCAQEFKTEVVEKATTICPFCASSKLEEIKESEAKKAIKPKEKSKKQTAFVDKEEIKKERKETNIDEKKEVKKDQEAKPFEEPSIMPEKTPTGTLLTQAYGEQDEETQTPPVSSAVLK